MPLRMLGGFAVTLRLIGTGGAMLYASISYVKVAFLIKEHSSLHTTAVGTIGTHSVSME